MSIYFQYLTSHKTYKHVKQNARKEICSIANYLLIYLHLILRKKEDLHEKTISKATNKLCNRVVILTPHFQEFHIYVYFTQYDKEILTQVDRFYTIFHNSNEIILQF